MPGSASMPAQSRRCSWICSSMPTPRRRARSRSISTPPMIRCMDLRKGDSSTAITTATAICRSMIFCGRHLLAAKLRRSNIDAAAGAVDEVARIVRRIRARWPRVVGRHLRPTLLRGDSGFCREALMLWCEANRVDYVLGLARNKRLEGEITAELHAARAAAERTGKPARRFRDVTWSTRDSWAHPRRVIGKAEWTTGAANPRFVVTSLKPDEIDARRLYEVIYCAVRRSVPRCPRQGAG